MTLEEIKSNIRATIKETQDIRAKIEPIVGDTLSGIYDAIARNLEVVLYRLDTLEHSWHPYPEEKPKKDGAYLITRYTKHGGIFIDIDSWISEYEMFDSTEDIPSSMKVLAWMELPKPYKKEE